MVNAANLAMFIGVLFGVIPAMVLMYVMLQRFEGFFDEKRLFRYLMVGLIAGAAITLFQVLVFRLHEPLRFQQLTLEAGLLPLALIYPVLEAAAKTMVLNWHTLAGRPDTPYYGTSLGIGFGAISAFIVVARAYAGLLGGAGAAALSHFDIVVFSLFLFLLFVGGVMIHAGTGVIIGKATSERGPLRGAAYAAIATIPFYVAYYGLWAPQFAGIRFLFPVVLLAYGLWLVRYAMFTVLEGLVPEEIAKKVRRDMRKRQRA